jgi:hypothetical protein
MNGQRSSAGSGPRRCSSPHHLLYTFPASFLQGIKKCFKSRRATDGRSDPASDERNGARPDKRGEQTQRLTTSPASSSMESITLVSPSLDAQIGRTHWRSAHAALSQIASLRFCSTFSLVRIFSLIVY